MSEVAWDEEGFIEFVQIQVNKIMLDTAEVVVESARDHASGRPGPNIITGDLKAYMKAEPSEEPPGSFDIFSDSIHGDPGVNYPSLLEIGYTHRNGKEVHYPFLEPGLRALFGPAEIVNPAAS